MSRPIGIDLFAGAGGMSLGFEQAGFDVVAAVELDPVHAAVHKHNFPLCATIPRSVTDLTGQDIRAASSLSDNHIDVVFGGAPCQGFSMIGQRALDDPRNALVKDFVRLVRELDAEYFVFENVKGLTQGKHREFLNELIKEFETAGYHVERDWQVLNAANYGVPQDRQRLILMGGKLGNTLPTYPSEVADGPTCRDALNDLPDAELFEELKKTDAVNGVTYGKPSSYAKQLRGKGNDAWLFGHPRTWATDRLTSSARTEHTDISRRRFRETEQGKVEPISRLFKLPVNGVSNTLRAGTDSARGAFTSPRPIHYQHDRCVTVREMARLHGFPDWFRFNATKWHGARQIGNAVPPPLARAVATSVMDALDVAPTRPSKPLRLGDEVLLTMGNNEAARYFEVKNPIGRRDRKSGAKKRKQHEIEELNALNRGAELIDGVAG